MSYDIRIWEEIRDRVTWKASKLPEDIKREILSDRSLQEFQGSEALPWQLREVMQQRAESWIQRLYDSCCNAYRVLGKEPSVEFDMAVWAYCIEPFIMREQLNDHGYRASELLELLLLAAGSPPERRRLLKVSQKDACIAVKGRIWEIWHDKLLHLPPRWHEAAAAIARFNAMERKARRLGAGLPPGEVQAPQQPVPPPVKRPQQEAKPATLQPTPVHELMSVTTTEPTLPEPSQIFPECEKPRSLPVYESTIKRAILLQLLANHRASDIEVCRGLDATGDVELPDEWKTRENDRLFASAYRSRIVRSRIEVTISKIRSDLRRRGFIPKR